MNELIKEYKSWINENQNFIIHLKNHDSALYTRFMPVYMVLNFLYEEYSNNQDEFTEDLFKIFQVGFEFIYSQIFTCKIYLEKTFNNDFHQFIEYDKVIGYLLYVEDLRYELKEHDQDADENIVNNLVRYLEDLMINKEEIPETLNLYVDAEIHKVIEGSIDFNNIIDIFVEIAETLGIDLYYETDYLVGKDI
ncbi:hypothetical protein ACAG96_05610 [Candidatus Izemoplasma sp. B36]|uniref:hypothetical protein n=1 Tax=Candidatus Izemoplasma sp. B36 TaxID=3242468 RepID=UPI003556CDB5